MSIDSAGLKAGMRGGITGSHRVLGRDEERLACFFKSGLQVEYAMARGEGVDKT